MSSPPVFRLYIHTSRIFPWPTPQQPSREATQTWSHQAGISQTLALLPSAEQTAVTRFFHPADASRCLSSLLLKHLAIMRSVGVPFHESTITQQRDIRNGKPFYAPGGVEFNVSHHGEYVVCIGTTIPSARVGVDIVQIDVEKDTKKIDATGGFQEWVDVFSDVLSEQERRGAVEVARRDGVAAGLRRFYTTWACKEAYIKLTADALMAPYLKDLEFPGLKVPTAGTEGMWGEAVITDILLRGQPIRGVRIELIALGKEYIVASAVDLEVVLPSFTRVEIDGLTLKCFENESSSDANIYPLHD